MSNYVPIAVALVTCRLQGKPIPPEVKLAELYPCQDCGAPAGMACTEKTARCWVGRLLSEEHWDLIRKARKKGRGASGGFRDEVYHGLLSMGMNGNNLHPLAVALRWMSKENVAIIKSVLDAMP